MKISELTDAIAATYRVAPEKRRPIFAKGPPGIGKSSAGSDAAEKIAAEAGLPFRDLTREPWSADATAAFGFMSLQATIEDPITLSGLPARDGDVARFLPFADKLPTGGQGIIEISELPTAPPAVQAGLYEFFLRGKLGSYRLPDGGGLPGQGWYVYATGNRAQDRAQVQRMPTPLVSRIVHATIQLDLRVWMDWALTSGKVRPEIVAFLNFRSAHPADGIPDIFDTFDPARADTPYACHDSETDVLTEHGFVPWPQVTGLDRFATLRRDGTLEYQHAIAVHRLPYAGELVHFTSPHLDLLVTPEHNVLVKPCYLKLGPQMFVGRQRDQEFSLMPAAQCAGEIAGVRAFRMRRDCEEWHGGADSETFTLPAAPAEHGTRQRDIAEHAVNSEAWFEYLGWWIADGSYQRDKKGQYHTDLVQRDKTKLARVWELAQRLEIGAALARERVVTGNRQIYNALALCGKRADRHVPRYVMEASPRLMRAFLRGLIGGDGWRNNGTTYIATGLSKHVADAVQEITLKLGIGSNITYRAMKHCYVVSVATTRNLRPAVGLNNVSRKQYSGMVYCATVPNGTLLTRRNGKTVWSGNCPRTYHMASDVLDAGHAPGIEHELLSGCIGEGPATELIAFLRVYRDLVSPDAILMSPATAAVPGDLSALYAVCGALARKVSDKSIDRLVIYLDRLPAEYAILTMTEAVRRDPTLQSTAGFLRFAHQYGEILT